jgi:hypothetical protein
MYMPGLFRTGSSPSRTVIWPASYVPDKGTVVVADSRDADGSSVTFWFFAGLMMLLFLLVPPVFSVASTGVAVEANTCHANGPRRLTYLRVPSGGEEELAVTLDNSTAKDDRP